VTQLMLSFHVCSCGVLNSVAFGAHYVKVVEDRWILSASEM